MAIQRFPIEASHILMFARAVGDDNPVYRDPEAAAKSEAKGIISPPTFVSAGAQFDPEYRLRPRPGATWVGSGKFPSGLQRDKPASSSGAPAGHEGPTPPAGGRGPPAAQHTQRAP